MPRRCFTPRSTRTAIARVREHSSGSPISKRISLKPLLPKNITSYFGCMKQKLSLRMANDAGARFPPEAGKYQACPVHAGPAFGLDPGYAEDRYIEPLQQCVFGLPFHLLGECFNRVYALSGISQSHLLEGDSLPKCDECADGML